MRDAGKIVKEEGVKRRRRQSASAAFPSRGVAASQPYRTKAQDLMGNSMDIADCACILYPLWLLTDRLFSKPLVFPSSKVGQTKPPRHVECSFNGETTSSEIAILVQGLVAAQEATAQDESSDAD